MQLKVLEKRQLPGWRRSSFPTCKEVSFLPTEQGKRAEDVLCLGVQCIMPRNQTIPKAMWWWGRPEEEARRVGFAQEPAAEPEEAAAASTAPAGREFRPRKLPHRTQAPPEIQGRRCGGRES